MRRLALCLALAGCALPPPQTPPIRQMLPLECSTVPVGTMALVQIVEPHSLTCNGEPALGCTTAQTVIRLPPPYGPHDTGWLELVLHEFCHVSKGAWHP